MENKMEMEERRSEHTQVHGAPKGMKAWLPEPQKPHCEHMC